MRNSRLLIGTVVMTAWALIGPCFGQDAPVAISEAIRQTTSPFTSTQDREVTDYIEYHVKVMRKGTDEQVLTARRRLLEHQQPNARHDERQRRNRQPDHFYLDRIPSTK